MNGVESLFSEEELLHALELANTAPPLPPAFHSGGGMHVHPAVMAQFQQAQGMLGGGGGLEGAYGLQMVSDENANPRLYTPPNLRGGPDPLSETPVLQQPMPQVRPLPRCRGLLRFAVLTVLYGRSDAGVREG